MTKMVEVPWHDGTIREVEEGTVVSAGSGDGQLRTVVYAMENGWCLYSNAKWIESWGYLKGYGVYEKASEPPQPKVVLPTAEGSVIAGLYMGKPTGWVVGRTSLGWYGLYGEKCSEENLKEMIADGDAKVVFDSGKDEIK